MKRLLFALLATVGCDGTTRLGERHGGQIIGKDDSIRLNADGSNIPAKYKPTIDAFGLLRLPGSTCSATHIGNGLALSAGHCFEAGLTRTNDVSCSGSSVDWGAREGAEPAFKSSCKIIKAEQTTDLLDYAIFEVDPVPPVKVDIELAMRPVKGAALTIFGHPRGEPETWSNVGKLQDDTTSAFLHDVDTDSGNSGSSVLLDDSLKVMGIHDGSSGTLNYGTFLVDTPLHEFIPGAPGGELTVTLSPTSVTLAPGASATVTVSTSAPGGAQTVTLGVSGLPSGVTGSFTPPSVSSGMTSTLTLLAAASAPGVTATFTVTAAGVSSKTAMASLTVPGAAPSDLGTSDHGDMARSGAGGAGGGGSGAKDLGTGGTGGGAPDRHIAGGCTAAPLASTSPAELILALVACALVARRRAATRR